MQTKVFDANVAGMIPGSVEQPKAGVYVTEAKPSKLSWYLEPSITVKKTCGSDFAANSYRISDEVDAPARATNPMTIANADLGDEYTVTVRLKNTMTEKQAKSLPAFITGNTEKGTMQPRLFLMAPEAARSRRSPTNPAKWCRTAPWRTTSSSTCV